MKTLLVGLLGGVTIGPMTLAIFAQAVPPNVSEIGGTVGGLAGAGSIVVLLYLVRDHNKQNDKKDEDHRKELAASREEAFKREQAMMVLFTTTNRENVTDFKNALKDLRDDLKQNTERLFGHSEKVVAAIERANEALIAVARNQEELNERVGRLEEGSGLHEPLKSKDPPRELPPTGGMRRRRTDRGGGNGGEGQTS